jgi:hypothetical protein
MIITEKMLELILVACPSFRLAWESFIKEWQDESEKPFYLALSTLARHLVLKLEAKDIVEFPSLFGVIERLIIDGDTYVREAVIVGLLEDLQNPNIYANTHSEQFRTFLLPESQNWWDKLHKFWNEGKILVDD